MKCVVLTVFLFMAGVSFGQGLFVGWGQMENIHAGIVYPAFKNLSCQSILGFAKGNCNIAVGQKILAPIFKSRLMDDKWRIDAAWNATLWSFRSPWNSFINVSYGPEIQCSRSFGRKSRVGVYAGYLRNHVLFYKRTTYEMVGWPKNWQPTFGIQWHFSNRK